MDRTEVTEKEQRILAFLRRLGRETPYGEYALEALYQDSVLVRINVVNKKETVKF